MNGQQRGDGIRVCAESKARGGFTLIELLLVITILMIFMASAVFYMSPALQGVQLEEGAARFESMFKFASAEATQTGKRVLVRFTSTQNGEGRTIFVAKVATENDPMGNPGVFSDTPRVAWLDQSIEDLVSVVSVVHQEMEDPEATGEEVQESEPQGRESHTDVGGDEIQLAERENYSAMLGNVNGVSSATESTTATNEQSEVAATEAEDSEAKSVLFYPDGSSDTVVVQLVSADAADSRVAEVRLNGVTGMVEHEILSTMQSAETEEDAEEVIEPQADESGEESYANE